MSDPALDGLDAYLDEQEERAATDVLNEVAEYIETLRAAAARERATFQRYDNLIVAGSRKRSDRERRAEAARVGPVLVEIADTLQAILE